MIKGFRHKGIQQFFTTGSTAGIVPAHALRLGLRLQALNTASSPADMNVPGWRLHALKGQLQGHWAVNISGNWRLTFMFEGADAILVDYQDYH